ncbi:MAG TPA: hypothetical protein VF546_23545 [Pyrinomonadaceae bacterium]|jgi:hypothetical protein
MLRNVSSLALILTVVSTLTAQPGGGQKKKYVLVPAEQTLAVIAVQPGCPVQFEDVKTIRYLDGGGTTVFRLRNRSTKAIRSVRFAWLGVEGTYALSAWPRAFGSPLLMPGQLEPGDDIDEQEEAVPLTDKLAEQLGLRGPMKGITILMVVKVEFADGSTYNAEPSFQALRAYGAKLGGFEEDEIP